MFAIQALTELIATTSLAGTQPQAEPLVIELDIPGSILNMDPVGEYFITPAPVTVKVGSIMPRWRISCEATNAIGPKGEIIDTDQFEIIFESNKLTPGSLSKKEPLNLGHRSVLVEGGITGPRMLDVCSFFIRANCMFQTNPDSKSKS